MTLPRFEVKPTNDFHLWELRLQAILESKDLWHVMTPNAYVTTTQATSSQVTTTVQGATSQATSTPQVLLIVTDDQRRKAAAIIINGLGDKPLRVVTGDIKNPQVMLLKLRERYASTKLSTRIRESAFIYIYMLRGCTLLYYTVKIKDVEGYTFYSILSGIWEYGLLVF